VVRNCAQLLVLDHLAPHDLRRTCAKLCHVNGGELEQIQFLLGHASVLTTERYLGCKQNLEEPVNDQFGCLRCRSAISPDITNRGFRAYRTAVHQGRGVRSFAYFGSTLHRNTKAARLPQTGPSRLRPLRMDGRRARLRLLSYPNTSHSISAIQGKQPTSAEP